MPFDEILDLAKSLLAGRRTGVPVAPIESLRPDGVLPESVVMRRSFGVNDDLAAANVLADGVELVELRKRVGHGVASLFQHPRHLVDAWAMCETLRRLGFSSDDVAIGWGSVTGHGDNIVYAALTSGQVRMIVCVTRFDADNAVKALEGWTELWEDVVKAGEDDLSVLLSRSSLGEYSRLVALIAEIARQGIGIPAAPGVHGPLTLLAGPSVSLTQGGTS
jgi:hypothetical protein